MNDVKEPIERKSSCWRFTVREGVLALVAIGLLAVLVVEHQPWTKAFWSKSFDGSDFMNELTQVKEHEEDSGDDNVLAPICNRLVSKGKVECETRGFGGGSARNLAERSAEFHIRTPGVRPAIVVGEFRREVEKRLTRHGFSLAGGEHPIYDTDDNQGFYKVYKKDRIRGFLYVYPFASDGFDPEKDAWRLIVVVCEHHKGGYGDW